MSSKMNNLKINDKEMKMLLVLGGLVMLFLVYRLAFLPMQEQNDALDEELTALTTQIADMEHMVEDQSSYENQTMDMQSEITSIFDSIPPNLTSEDEIIYAYNLENKYDISIQSLSLPDAQVIYTMSEDGSNPIDTGKVLYSVPVAIACTASYEGIKDFLRDIAAEEHSAAVNDIALTYDSESGYLSGTMTVNMYYLYGSDREYVPAVLNGVVTGTDNIFGTIVTGTAADGEATDEDTSDDDEDDDED